jgi:hypothetical protein
MTFSSRRPLTGEAARFRLLSDQALRPIAEQRARLDVLARRLDQAGRGALMQALAGRVRKDRRLAPVFKQLVQTTLKGLAPSP